MGHVLLRHLDIVRHRIGNWPWTGNGKRTETDGNGESIFSLKNEPEGGSEAIRRQASFLISNSR